jgi:hypothetical protein
MNSLSEDSLIFPGMKLKLAPSAVEEKKKDYILQQTATFCTVEGQIEGSLTLFKNHLKFLPSSLNNQSTLRFSNESLKVNPEDFQVTLNYLDIFDVQLLDNQGYRSREHVYIVQILIRSTGKEPRSERALARVYFKVLSIQVSSKICDVNKKNQEALDKSHEIIDKLAELILNTQEVSENATKVPFPEYLEHPAIEQETPLQVSNSQILEIHSEILNTQETSQIYELLPDVLKFSSCKIMYSSQQHGFSLRTLFNRCEESGPFIILVVDADRYKFGAFIPMSLKCCNEFYGDGTVFVFTFKEKEKIRVFRSKWTSEKLVSTYYEGIIVGKG